MIPALLTVVLIAIVLIGSLRTDALGATAFYDAARNVASTQAASSQDFLQVATASVALNRDQYVALFDQLDASIEEDLAAIRLEDLDPDDVPDRIRGPQRIAELTLQTWREGLALFEEASLQVVDDPGDTVAMSRLGEAIALLRTGDTLYVVLVEELEALRLDLELPEAASPDVVYLPASAGTPAFLDALAARLAASAGLVGVTGVSIANVVTVPAATGGEEAGAARLPNTETLEVQVVVANDGNVPERDLTVLVRVDDLAGNPVVSENRTIEELGTSGVTTVSFSEIPVVGGEFYAIRVGVITNGEGAPSPEAIDFDVFVSEAAAETEG